MIRTANMTMSVSRNAGGLFESVRRLVQSLEVTGIEVRVFGVRDEFTDTDITAWNPVTVEAFQPTWPAKFGYSPRFLEELLAFEPDLSHSHGIWVYPSIATNTYSTRKHRPYIISAHGMLDPWAIRNSRWKKAIAHFLYEGAHLRGARCLRALCESEARAMRQAGLKNDIAVIPNGIDPPAGPPPGSAPWADLIESGKKVLLYLGRIHPKKGLANLIRAWAAVNGKQKAESRKQESEWVLAIAGWDEIGHEAELKRLATELEIQWSDAREHPSPREIAASISQGNSNIQHPTSSKPPSVVFLGPQFGEGKAACYHYCDAFVLPSFSEGVPMVVLEAWVNSKPVLMTPQCNLPEGFSSGAALKVEPTVEGVTEGLNEFWRMTDAERAVMGSRGHALAAERFVWPKIAAQMKELYEWILGGGEKPGWVQTKR